MLESVGAVAHGAKGVLYYLFDTDDPYTGQPKVWGMYDSFGDADSIEAMNAGVAEAGERLDWIANLLDGFSYKWTSESDPGYAYNINKVGATYYLTAFGNQDSTEAYPFTGKGWFIQTVACEDSSDVSTWVEVTRWAKDSNNETYVICSRDTGNDHDVTVYFNPDYDYDVYIDGYYQGSFYGTETCPLTIPRGDVVILSRWTKLNYCFLAKAQRTQRNPPGKGLSISCLSCLSW